MGKRPSFETIYHKIHGLEQSVAELEKSERMFQRAGEIVGRSSVVTYTRKSGEGWPVEYISDNVRSIFGWGKDDFEKGRITYAKVIHPDDLERVKQEVSASSADPGVETINPTLYRIVDRDGNVKWVEDYATIIRSGDGTVLGLEGVLLAISDRKRSEMALRHHTEFERLIAEISSELAGISGSDIDTSIICALGFAGAFIGADRACVIHLNTDDASVDITHEWYADGAPPGLGRLRDFQIDFELPYFYENIKRHEVVDIPSMDDLPPEARRERDFFESQGVKSLLVIPMESIGNQDVFLCFGAAKDTQVWTKEDQHLLRFLAGTISLVIERKNAESERERLISELQAALADVKTLSGLLPICSFCKKIRDDKGYWNQLEEYITDHSDAQFSHGICRECAVKHYPDLIT